MAREEKRIELKPVDDLGEIDDAVVRLVSDETPAPPRGSRGEVQPDDVIVTRRLDLPVRADFELRTHQPGIEALIEPAGGGVQPLEGDWGKVDTDARRLPWGWFGAIAAILIGSVIWSLTRVGQSGTQAHQIRETTKSILSTASEEEKEASALIDALETVKVRFFSAKTIDEMLRLVRDPERVRPLMEDYYLKHPLTPHHIVRTRSLAPQTIANHGNFWTTSVELETRETASLILEVTDSGEAKVDWETFVCYQPMDWNDFATQRPAGKTLDFRVHVQIDNLFSHEFADSTQWSCFRLTALGSIETLFGYARTDSPVAREMSEAINAARGAKQSMILRVTIPEGLQSHRGVMIEKLMSPRWLYLDPPDSGP